MALDHFSIWHFKASHFTTWSGTIGSVISAVVDWLTPARRRGRR